METNQPEQFLEDTYDSMVSAVSKLSYPQCCELDPQGEYHTQSGHDDSIQEPVKEKDPTIFTISAIAFDFDFVTSDPLKSRADEIRVLLVKNKKPPRKSKEGKPGGFGLPTGQLESKESMLKALERETRDESGCSVRKIVGKLFVVNKLVEVDDKPVPNEIHVFLVEASDVLGRIREVDEIDGSIEPWIPLRQVFEMPMAQDKNGDKKNPNGIYFMHLKRLYRAIEFMVYGPSPEDLIDNEEVVRQWVKPNRKALVTAMIDLKKDGLLEEFLPKDAPEEVSI